MQTRADEFARGLVADDEGGGDGETNVSAVSETRGLIEKEEGGGEAASANEVCVERARHTHSTHTHVHAGTTARARKKHSTLAGEAGGEGGGGEGAVS